MRNKKNSVIKYPFKENTIYCGDNLDILKEFPAECVDLIYIDPPFFSNRTYEVIWGDSYEIRSFEDRWEGGIQHYIDWMNPRIEQLHRILKPIGSFYLHADWHADAYLRVLCDQIFGYKNCRRQLIWKYFGPSETTKNYPKKHDTIWFYTKGDEWTFNQSAIMVEPDAKTIKRYDKVDENSKRYKNYLQKDGSYKRSYMPEGTPSEIFEIPFIQNNSKEKLGYPTQKPEALLERIIQASSNEGDLVLDSFCGCGTAIAVAQRLKRHFIGVDISPTACRLMASRINYSVGQIIGIPYTVEELKVLSPFEFQNWVVLRLGGRISPKKSSDLGVDGIVPLEGNIPIQVKQSDHISRPEIDKFESAIRRLHKTKGYFVAFSFTKGAVEEIARCKNQEGIEIVYLTIINLVPKENGNSGI